MQAWLDKDALRNWAYVHVGEFPRTSNNWEKSLGILQNNLSPGKMSHIIGNRFKHQKKKNAQRRIPNIANPLENLRNPQVFGRPLVRTLFAQSQAWKKETFVCLFHVGIHETRVCLYFCFFLASPPPRPAPQCCEDNQESCIQRSTGQLNKDVKNKGKCHPGNFSLGTSTWEL